MGLGSTLSTMAPGLNLVAMLTLLILIARGLGYLVVTIVSLLKFYSLRWLGTMVLPFLDKIPGQFDIETTGYELVIINLINTAVAAICEWLSMSHYTADFDSSKVVWWGLFLTGTDLVVYLYHRHFIKHLRTELNEQ